MRINGYVYMLSNEHSKNRMDDLRLPRCMEVSLIFRIIYKSNLEESRNVAASFSHNYGSLFLYRSYIQTVRSNLSDNIYIYIHIYIYTYIYIYHFQILPLYFHYILGASPLENSLQTITAPSSNPAAFAAAQLVTTPWGGNSWDLTI